jgi:streptogramin lyase
MNRVTSLVSFLLLNLFVSQLVAQSVSTIAGTGKQGHTGDGGPAVKAMVGEPYGLTLGPDGALYVCEIKSHVIRRIDEKTGKISTVAGSGQKGYSGDGGSALKAKLNEPYEIRFDQAGNMYFVEMVNNIVRRVDAKTGKIETVAGTGKKGFSGDGGLATKATFSRPHSIALDKNDNLYICDIGNHRVRRVNLKTGIVTTFSGTGDRKPTPDGATLSGTPLNGPRALDFFQEGSGKGALYLALREGNKVYRIDLDKETLHHIAGTGKKGYTGHGGPAKAATLSGPKGISVAPNGDIYLADTESHTIRVIRKKNGVIETAVGDGKKGDGPDGAPAKCRMARPHGVYVGPRGNVYIGDSETFRVRKLISGQHK